MAQTFNDAVPASTRNALEDLTAIRNNFAALKSCFSGATAPPNPVAGMWWYDTTANILKLRNEANNAWLNVYDFANACGLAVAGYRTGGWTLTAGAGLSGGGTTASNRTISLASGAVTLAHLQGYTAGGTYVVAQLDTPRATTVVGSYQMVKEVVLDKGGALRILFDLVAHNVSATVYGRIYRNGAPVGTVRSCTGLSPATFTEDISGWAAGDRVQIYVNSWTTSVAVLSNFRIYSGTWPALRVTQD